MASATACSRALASRASDRESEKLIALIWFRTRRDQRIGAGPASSHRSSVTSSWFDTWYRRSSCGPVLVLIVRWILRRNREIRSLHFALRHADARTSAAKTDVILRAFSASAAFAVSATVGNAGRKLRPGPARR